MTSARPLQIHFASSAPSLKELCSCDDEPEREPGPRVTAAERRALAAFEAALERFPGLSQAAACIVAGVPEWAVQRARCKLGLTTKQKRFDVATDDEAFACHDADLIRPGSRWARTKTP